MHMADAMFILSYEEEEEKREREDKKNWRVYTLWKKSMCLF